MSSNRFVFSGLEELKAELRNLPADLTGEAGHIVEAAANGAAVAARTAYGRHVVTGTLEGSVQVQPYAAGQFGVIEKVVVHDPIAWIVENGTEARHYITVKGVRHLTGKMPGLHLFIPAMIRARTAMYVELRDLLERHGLAVSGEP